MLSSWSFRRYNEVKQEMEEDRDDDNEIGRASNHDRTLSGPFHKVMVVLASLFILLLTILSINFFSHASPIEWRSCGDSPTTARERGCSFDIITFAWQMPECYDKSLVDEFAGWQPWTFWADEQGNETVSLAEARVGDRELWLPWQFHVVHCTFAWRQMHRAYENGWIDEHSRSYHHTTHCQKMLLMDCVDEGRFCILPNDTVITLANLIYPACVQIERGNMNPWDGFMTQKDVYV